MQVLRPLPPLALVELSVLRVDSRLAALPHVADLISAYLEVLNPFGGRPLARAAACGSTCCFQREVQRVEFALTASPADAAVRSHAFACAMKTAIETDNLMIVQAIHRLHPEPLAVSSLRYAFQYGSLELVQWVIANRHDRLCCDERIANLCRKCYWHAFQCVGTHDLYRVVRWLDGIGLETGLHDRSACVFSVARIQKYLTNEQLVRWLDESGKLSQGDAAFSLRETIRSGPPQNAELVAFLVEKGYRLKHHELVECMAAGSCDPALETVIDAVVASPLCTKIRMLFDWGPTRPDGAKVLQWDRNGLWRIRGVDFESTLAQQSLSAVRLARTDVLTYLLEAHGHRPSMVRNGISEAISELDRIRLYEWLYQNRISMSRYQFFDGAAANGHLPLLQWLQQHRPDRPCTANAMDAAASNGHLEVVKWLHANRNEGCTTSAMDKAAWHGHLEILQWLHANRREGCSDQAMINAAAQGHLDVVKWLVSIDAQFNLSILLQRAALGGHVDVVHWLCGNLEDACKTCLLFAVLYMAHTSSKEGVLDSVRWLRADCARRDSCVGCCLEVRSFKPLLENAVREGDLVLAQDLVSRHYTNEKIDTEQLAWFCQLTRMELDTDAHMGLLALLHSLPSRSDWERPSTTTATTPTSVRQKIFSRLRCTWSSRS